MNNFQFSCAKKLRDSSATLGVRESHSQINRKTFECRERMREDIAAKRRSNE